MFVLSAWSLAEVVSDDVVWKVSEVEARSALIQLTPPTVNTAELVVEESEFQYELSLSDKRDGSYTVMYRFVPRIDRLCCQLGGVLHHLM